MLPNPPDEVLRELLRTSSTIAVVGCSPKPERTSHQIAKAMQGRGYRIVPVHPAGGTILGETVYASLSEIPFPVDIVDVFRRSEEVLPVAEEAVRIGARALWLQQGVINDAAVQVARGGGLIAVQDACLAVLHRLLA